jgi:hypothetical protein
MKLLLIYIFSLIFKIDTTQSYDDFCIDSIYKNAFNQIRYSECIRKKHHMCDTNIIYFLSNEVLYLLNPLEIDTNSNSFYRDRIFYEKSYTSYIDDSLLNFNYVNDSIFYDTTKTKFIVFFTYIIRNYFIAEIYRYNYFPVIYINNSKEFQEDINYHKKHNYLKEFSLTSRILFLINNNEIIRFYCK